MNDDVVASASVWKVVNLLFQLVDELVVCGGLVVDHGCQGLDSLTHHI